MVNLLSQANHAARQAQFDAAQSLVDQALDLEPHHEGALSFKAKIALHLKHYAAAESALKVLVLRAPQNLQYAITLAQLYVSQNDFARAPTVFEPLLKQFKHPDLSFNYAWFLTRSGDYKNAVIHYQQAIDQDVDHPEEVHLNLANLYSTRLASPTLAKRHLESALDCNPNYIDALYNLGNMHEDAGERGAATECFRKILHITPNHGKAAARIAMAIDPREDSKDIISEAIDRLKALLADPSLVDDDRVDCCYALGKLYDHKGDYAHAFSSWQLANSTNKKLIGPFDQSALSARVDHLLERYSAAWFDRFASTNTAAPVFICGMFRSGSTLLEQMLAAHPNLTAGGELDYFPKVALQLNAEKPPAEGYSGTLLATIANNYEEELLTRAQPGTAVTDKRPDNVLHIGLIKTVFPNARIIITQRALLDTALSIYSHRFGLDMSYACDLKDIVFYAEQLTRLVDHWVSLFPTTITVVDYDNLVRNPQAAITEVLKLLQLDWNEACLTFYRLRNTVSTASVWQIRQPLYESSLARWRNYQSQLEVLL